MNKEKKQSVVALDRELKRLHSLLEYEDLSIEYGPDHPISIILRQIEKSNMRLLVLFEKLHGVKG